MADLDNRSKRASSVQILKPFAISPPEPTLVLGDIDQADRQHIAFSYSGILAAAAGGLAQSIFADEIHDVVFGGQVVK